MTADGPQHPPLPDADRASDGRPPPAARPDPTPIRFTQPTSDGLVEWVVVEADAAAVPGAHGSHCLVFTRPDCIRRVWDYPADWRALDPAGLAALSWRR